MLARGAAAAAGVMARAEDVLSSWISALSACDVVCVFDVIYNKLKMESNEYRLY